MMVRWLKPNSEKPRERGSNAIFFRNTPAVNGGPKMWR